MPQSQLKQKISAAPASALQGRWRGLLRRGAFVLFFALLIALIYWLLGVSALDNALVYSVSISLSIWLCIDAGHFVFSPRFMRIGSRASSRWFSPSRALWVGGWTVLGYVLGSSIGNLYSGGSMWGSTSMQGNQFYAQLVLVCVLSLAFNSYFTQRGHAESLAKQASEAQMRLLQSQLNPHMMFNTLANLRALIVVDAERALSMLDSFTAYLRSTLSASQTPLHTLKSEFALLHDYLHLMQIRMGARLQFDLALDAEASDLLIPSFLLQPLVENAVVHGLEPSSAGGRIQVQVHCQKQRLRIEVRDNGVGSVLPVVSAVGLTSVAQQLQAAYGTKAWLSVSAVEPSGFCVALDLPLHPDTAFQ